MRIWLAENLNGADCGCLEAALRQVTDQAGEDHNLVGVRPINLLSATDLRAQQVEALIVADGAAAPQSTLTELLENDVSVLVATTVEQCERYQALAQLHPIWFISTRPTPEMLRLALRGLAACYQRQSRWKAQLSSLQQRLNDRIVIERAKGILVQQLGVSEEEAYKRLRVSSRRQRRQIRDIAQSLIDTQALLLPEQNGYADHSLVEGFEVNESEV
jgi:two-component system, response regulator / RNA-binding antiterminator